MHSPKYQYTLHEAQLKCIDNKECTGLSAKTCKGSSAKFNLCMAKYVRRKFIKDTFDYTGFGCMYLKPGNNLNNYLKYFIYDI